jgi:ABC-2 type transport system ATP-binding protein
LKELPEIRDVSLFGSGLHLVTPEATSGMAAVRRLLADRDVGEVKMEVITPSMEDVFISLIEAVDRQSDQDGKVQA